MQADKIEEVAAENLGEGYRIVREGGELSPVIQCVEWIGQSADEDDFNVEVHFDGGSVENFVKGTRVRQIWHEYL